MSRLSKIPVERWDPELVAMTQGDTATVIEQGITRMLAHCPEMAKGAFWRRPPGRTPQRFVYSTNSFSWPVNNRRGGARVVRAPLSPYKLFPR